MTDKITLTEATRYAPGHPHLSAIWRWCRKGIKARTGERVHLKHIRVGGRILTSHAWLDEFFEAVAEADRAHFEQQPVAKPTAEPSRSDERRRRDYLRAGAALAADGF